MGIMNYLKNPWRIPITMQNHGLGKYVTDKLYIRCLFREQLGYWPNLNNPKSFNEKLQWLKLYDRKPIYTTMVDKYAVKKYVADRIGEEYIIPTLGVWDKFDDIDFDVLPDQFVLKCTHDSGGLVICKDKSKLDIDQARKKIEKSISNDYYLQGREWPYKNVKRRIIAEAYMEDSQVNELRDYKFFCFNGCPKYCQVISNRSIAETIDFYDMDWKHQEFNGLSLPRKPFPTSTIPISEPRPFGKMKEIVALLSKDIPFVRVDLYCIGKRIYFGEMTFYPACGYGTFYPTHWNILMGNLLVLPKE